MDRSNIEKIAKNAEDRVLLAKIWDKITAGMRKNIPANTGFLTLRELELCRYLFGRQEGLLSFGGYEGAERQMLIYLPEYLDKDSLYEEEAPLVCLRATFYDGDTKEIRDTVASLRLDSIISSGFRIGRSSAAQYVSAGKAAINGLPCEKPDKAVDAGDKISVRGLGKICLRSVNGQTKKGRISVVIDRYI